MPSSNLSGQHVVVIGGSSGIGKAVGQVAAAAGAAVTIGSRSTDKLTQAAKEIGGASTGVVDVTDEASLQSFFASIETLDHLVVCPGDMAPGSVYEVPLDDIRRSLNTKIIGQLLSVRHAGKKLSQQGSVVFMTGAAGFKPYADMSATAAANTAVAGMTRSLALELAPVRVNAVVGGLIDTPLWSFLPDEAREGFFEQTAQASPVRRVGQPEDVAVTVLHLLENTFITGSVVHVDGGGTL